LSAVWCRTGVSSPGQQGLGERLASRGRHVGHLRRVGDPAVEVPGQLVGAERGLTELGDRCAGLLAGEVGEVEGRLAPSGRVEDEGQSSHGVVHGPTCMPDGDDGESEVTSGLPR
jgi:hypothetical protein